MATERGTEHGPIVRRFVWWRLRYEVGWWIEYETASQFVRVWKPASPQPPAEGWRVHSAHEDR